MVHTEGREELASRIRDMRKNGHSYRSIRDDLKVSFTTIKEAVRMKDPVHADTPVRQEQPKPKTQEELEVERLRSLPVKERRVEAYRLFSMGKRPDEVVYMTGLPPEDVNQLYPHFLESEGLYEAAQLVRRRGHEGIKSLENIDDILKRQGIETPAQAEKELSTAHEMHKNNTTLEQLTKEAEEARENKEQMLKESEELKPFIEKAREAKEEVQRIQHDYPNLAPSEIARREAKSVLDEDYYLNRDGCVNREMLGLAVDAVALALRDNPGATYLIWPENIQRDAYEVHSRVYGTVVVPEYNERCRNAIMQYAIPYYRKLLLDRIANKSMNRNS